MRIAARYPVYLRRFAETTISVHDLDRDRRFRYDRLDDENGDLIKVIAPLYPELKNYAANTHERI